MAYTKTISINELLDGEMRGIVVGSMKVLIVNHAGVFHAYEDRCAHLGIKLSGGILKDNKITCPAHHWEYRASTGRGLNPNTVCLRRFAVKVEHGILYVDLGLNIHQEASHAG